MTLHKTHLLVALAFVLIVGIDVAINSFRIGNIYVGILTTCAATIAGLALAFTWARDS